MVSVLSLVAGALEPIVVKAIPRVKRQGISVVILFFLSYDMNTGFQAIKRFKDVLSRKLTRLDLQQYLPVRYAKGCEAGQRVEEETPSLLRHLGEIQNLI